MNTDRFYELINQAGPLPSETNDALKEGLDRLPSVHPARSYFIAAAQSNSRVGEAIQALRDWGAAQFGDPARGIPDPRSATPPSIPQQPETPPAHEPPTTPSGSKALRAARDVEPVPWAHASGITSLSFRRGQVVSFAITPPIGFSSNRKLGNFYLVPTDGSAYFNRLACISDVPGDFSGRLGKSTLKRGQDITMYFSVGGPPLGKYPPHAPVLDNADLVPGQTYYLNVKDEFCPPGQDTYNLNCGLHIPNP